MPIVQVTQNASELLQNVADTLGKARKVVVVTGAGISTNSGIPDFRSEHGLYSLIQAQFDKAEASGATREDEESVDVDISERPRKRRRISKTQDASSDSNPPSRSSVSRDAETEATSGPLVELNTPAIISGDNLTSPSRAESQSAVTATLPQNSEQSQRMTRGRASNMHPSLPRHTSQITESSSQSTSSNDATFSAPDMSRTSSQTEDSIMSSAPTQVDCLADAPTPRRTMPGGDFSSSPLSSPPPVLFDPFDNTNESMEGSSDCSDVSDSEETQTSADLLASQTSQSRLRNMKGRDLFDCNIWSDPLKTSVFYQFATTLRQKVKEVEPTTTHRFLARLRDVGKLARVYTQNIDEIEKKIGLSTDLKVGAGNKRRKSAKQPPIPEQCDKDSNDKPELVKGEDDPGGKEAPQSSHPSEDGARNKQRSSATPDKGVECVFLHGSLHALRCFVCARLCDWDQEGRESRTMSGEQPECPHCAGATAARQERGKRALGVGKLRPDIVLYGEEHPQSDLISPIVQHDLSASPDVLLVLGTSLRVHGLKIMVKEFAKAVHTKGGKVVFINFTKPSESTWGDVIDYWVEWDCDAWVEDLKERKPTLWMSPEAMTEHERQKREALAEKKRGSMLNKKRESIAAKKLDTVTAKRRATFQIPEPKPEPVDVLLPLPVVISEPRKPAKNPQAERNDYFCGAYCMTTVAEAFAMIRGEPFDFFGYSPPVRQPTPKISPPRRAAVKDRKPRKSAPAALTTTHAPESKVKVRRTPGIEAGLHKNPISRNLFKMAASGLRHRPQTPQRMAELCAFAGIDASCNHVNDFQLRVAANDAEPQESPFKIPQGTDQQLSTPPDKLTPPVSHAYVPTASISAAIKSNPRTRKPTSKVKTSVPCTPVPVPQAHASMVPKSAAVSYQENILPPFRFASGELAGPRLPTMEPALHPSPPHSPLDQTPLASLSPNQRKFGLRHLQHPMMLSAPLINLPFAVRKEPTPSPSDQLREEAAVALSSMRTWT
ncbi:hypothetical protein BJ170DRAFT_679764 [Xylariales sp. AK1849]|nr:hypothetical protein BJ170DRAFT_679764 [Xylariales sp. AK1849]